MGAKQVVIVGAGAAGLTAARVLHEQNIDVTVIERGQEVGGRLATDFADGNTYDRGFQVLLTAYPAVKKYINLAELDHKSFDPGAHILLPQGKRTTIGDPVRKPAELINTLLSPVGSMGDKLRLLKLVTYVKRRRCEQLFEVSEQSTDDYLRGYGFSESFITNFFRPFYGGIFLERGLDTSNRMFLFTFKMFAEGDAVLPKGGIVNVARALAKPLPTTAIRLNAEAIKVNSSGITLANGERVTADHVIDARAQEDQHQAWLPTVNVYFAVAKTSLPEKLITLLPGGCPVNNIAVLTGVQAGFSHDQQLISVSLFAPFGKTLDFYAREVNSSLKPWLADELSSWQPLRHYEIKRALPFSSHAKWTANPHRFLDTDGVWRIGDYRLGPSLQSAMMSGEIAAKVIIQECTRV